MAVMGLLFLSMIVEATDTKDLELWFFHDQSCPWCHHMAPDVKVVSKILNIKTVGLPDKGESIEGFDEVRQDNQAYRTHRVIYMPTLILVNTQTGEHQVISSGALNGDELYQRVAQAKQALKHV